jgi:hypothetical protein
LRLFYCAPCSADEQISEINEFLSWQMLDDLDDDDNDDPEEQKKNSQEEFINSDEFSSSIPIDPDQPGPSMFTKRSKKEKQ